MRQILYISDSVGEVTDETLISILRQSRSNNGLNGVTGFLWSSKSRFAQVLEGHTSVVDEVLQRIRADTRHENMRILDDREMDERMFGDWSMGQPFSTTGHEAYAKLLLSRLDEMDAEDLHAIVAFDLGQSAALNESA